MVGTEMADHNHGRGVAAEARAIRAKMRADKAPAGTTYIIDRVTGQPRQQTVTEKTRSTLDYLMRQNGSDGELDLRIRRLRLKMLESEI